MLKKSLDRRTGELGEIVVDARDEWGGRWTHEPCVPTKEGDDRS